MRVVFTICSNNYLAQAKTLGDSLIIHNPDYHFVIFLVDRISEQINYFDFKPYEIVAIEQVGIGGFEDMFARYNITELNTSVKPFIFDYLFSRNKDVDAIIYLDPDILIYDRFNELETAFTDYNILITPHFFTPIYDNHFIGEPGILNAGLYNLGFIGVKRSEESMRFLNWWMTKLKDQCYIDFKNGLFVDQLWINLAPLFFENVYIIRHLGYNVAYWNFHERIISGSNESYLVNNRFPLVFFHFSGYLLHQPDIISKYQTRFSFDQKKDVLPLYQDYRQRLLNNQYEKYSSLPCYFVQIKDKGESAKSKSSPSFNTSLRILYHRTIKRLLVR